MARAQIRKGAVIAAAMFSEASGDPAAAQQLIGLRRQLRHVTAVA
jgi:hypothetical protein